MSKHTPEPWMAGSHGSVISTPIPGITIKSDVEYYGGHMICESITKSNARRIVTCVNACAGMEDPAAEISELKRQRDELLASLGAAIQLIKQARLDWLDQNAESYDEDVVTPYDAILYRPILSLLEAKGSAS